MGNDWVTSVYHTREVTTFVEHTHIKIKYIGKIDCTSCSTFIRADRHHVFAVDLKVFECTEKTFDELVSRTDCLESI